MGLVLGCTLVATICTLVFFCLRKRKARGSSLWSLRQGRAFDLTYDPVGGPTSHLLPENYISTPFSPSATHLDDASTSPVARYHDTRYSQASTQRYDIHLPPSIFIAHVCSSERYIPSSLHELNDMAPSQPSLIPVPYHYASSSPAIAQGSKQSRLSQPSRSGIEHDPPVIVHTDIEEATQTPIELPPQYSEHRTPLPGFPTSEARTSSSSRKRG